LALEGGTLLLVLSCLLLSWCWGALVIVPPSKVYLCYRAALIVTFQLLGFFFPAQLDPDLWQQELPFYGANTTRSVPALGYPWPSPIIVVLWLCVVFWNASGFRAAGDFLGKQRKGKGALFILGCRAFPMFQHTELR
jgi:hypothetical protein